MSSMLVATKAATSIPPNVDARRKPSEEQLAHVLERMPMEEPEKKEVALNFTPLECIST